MIFWGKLIGVIAGFALGHGYFGAFIGLLIGHWIDLKLGGRTRSSTAETLRKAAERQAIFTTSIVALAAKLAKADGLVSREEVDAFKAMFSIPPSQMSMIADLWDEAKADPSGYEPHARRLAGAFADTPVMLAEVLMALNQIALADGRLHPAEEEFLRRVSEIFGISGQNFYRDAAEAANPDDYAVLGVSPQASMSDIKSAWRKLSREHHPDTLMAKGMPQEYIDLATKKMAEINAAYDRIRNKRGEK
ncbi:MAG TPA: TerB family tellurite resistance protein [Candidatus Sulfotelmatobacter sp.]|jgi:DnaJ like chaperone protein|nr:TerB family tellurite resistance protein [Candidatus Sulfotelmatobacter sp.]